MVSDGSGATGTGEGAIQLDSLPKSVLQSIYNVVTGKTESMSKDIEGNVLIKSEDISRLYDMLLDQLCVYTKVVEPKSTVVVKHSNHKSVTYSSWERFNALQVNNNEITSEMIIRLESLLRLPDTPGPQRCVLTINIDSSLPVIVGNRKRLDVLEQAGIFFFMSRPWNTVQVSIEFVDFIVAKSMYGVVEEWFSALQKTPKKRFNSFLIAYSNSIRVFVGQLGRIGMATYLISHAIISKKSFRRF
jgi:hypothetical protein